VRATLRGSGWRRLWTRTADGRRRKIDLCEPCAGLRRERAEQANPEGYL
jgi:hypothetical protein